jgi:hypothetical protein
MHIRCCTIKNSHSKPKTTQYIELLRRVRLKARLRAARERMAAAFPLNEEQWRAWIDDEVAGLRSADDVARVRGLYARAVKDYLSVELWASYLE